MEAVSNVLGAFAAHTRMDETEQRDVNFVGPRYLAAHLSSVPVGAAFVMLGNDYDALVQRTHKPPFKTYSERATIDPDTFTALVQHGFPNGISPQEASKIAPSFVHFCNSVLGDSEQVEKDDDDAPWKKNERLQQWQSVAYYLVGAYAKQPLSLERLLKAINNKDNNENIEHIEQMASAIKKFSYGRTGAQDIGAVIAKMSIPDAIGADFTTYSPTSAMFERNFNIAEQKNETPFLFSKPKKSVVLLEEATPPKVDLETLRPAMEDYRKRAGMAASVPTARIAKQMLLAAIDQDAPMEHIKPALSKYQTKLTPLISEEERTLVSKVVDALPVIPSFDPNQSARCKAVSHVTLQNEWNPRELLKHIVSPKDHMDARALHKYERAEIMGDKALVQAMAK